MRKDWRNGSNAREMAYEKRKKETFTHAPHRTLVITQQAPGGRQKPDEHR